MLSIATQKYACSIAVVEVAADIVEEASAYT